MSTSEQLRSLRRRRRAAGLCGRCLSRPARPHRCECEQCARRPRKRVDTRTRARLPVWMSPQTKALIDAIAVRRRISIRAALELVLADILKGGAR